MFGGFLASDVYFGASLCLSYVNPTRRVRMELVRDVALLLMSELVWYLSPVVLT